MGAELKPTTDQLHVEENQSAARSGRLPGHLDGTSDGVFGVLQQDERLNVLPGDQHLIPARPRGQGIRRCLRSALGHLHSVAGAQHRGVICVDVRGVITGAESPSQSSVS